MKKILFILSALFFAFNAFAAAPLELNTFFTPEEIALADQGELISRMYVKHNGRKENSHDSIKVPRTKFNDEDFSLYEVITDEKGFIPYDLTGDNRLKFYNTLTSFSKLEGMKYYSRRAGEVKKLVEDCYRVESLSGNKHADIAYNEIKPKVKNLFLQKDNKFGSLVYKSELYNEGDNFVLVNTSLEPMTKLFFDINEAEEYKNISFYLYNKEKKGFYYYSVQVMRVKMEMVLKNGMIGPTSFSNRLRAATVHLAKLLGDDREDKLNPWPGLYDDYKKKKKK